MRRIHALVFILLTVLLSGCAGGPGAAQARAQVILYSTPTPRGTPRPLPPTATPAVFQLRATSTPLPSATPVAIDLDCCFGPRSYPPGVNPLTGLEVADPGLLERRPILVKITNFPRSVRPQWGLSRADHVYEYYLEDGMTRFVGVFYGQDAARIGPVRSGRFFDEHLIRQYKGLFVFGAADPRVLGPWTESDFKNLLILERPDNCPPLCRIGSENNYNTLFLDSTQMSSYLQARGTANTRQALEGLYFEKLTPYSHQEGLRVGIRYSLVSYNLWEYDPALGRYLRSQDTETVREGIEPVEPLYDRLTGEQLAADNLVVLLVPHEYFINTATTEMVQINFEGEGPGIAYRDGRAYSIQWQRSASDQMVRLTYAGGRDFPLKPGNVWFQILGLSSHSAQIEDQSWRFTFSIP